MLRNAIRVDGFIIHPKAEQVAKGAKKKHSTDCDLFNRKLVDFSITSNEHVRGVFKV